MKPAPEAGSIDIDRVVMGIDIGGTGIKANLVEVETGELLGERVKLATPQPSTPEAVSRTMARLVDRFGWSGRLGITFPAIVRHGVTLSAANVDEAWIGLNAEEMFAEVTGLPVKVLNDADAAGVAEATHGAARGVEGVVLLLTFGTGIGSGLLVDGKLVPNTELGHLQMRGYTSVEHWVSAQARKREDISWKAWGKRMNEFLHYLNRLFSPDLFVVGGGVSRRWELYEYQIEVPVRVVPAELKNQAGIVGAAMAAAKI